MATKILTKAQREALAEAEAQAAQQFADIVDRDTLGPVLESLKAQLGIEGDIDATIHVYKMDVDGQNNDFKIWQSDDPDTYNLETLAHKFGSGRYRIRVYAKNADGGKPLVMNKVQAWLLSPEDEAKVQAAKYAAANPQSAPPAHNGEMRELIAGMMAGFQNLGALIANQGKVNPLAQMKEMAEVMKMIMPAPVVAAPDATTQLASMLGMMKNIKDIAGDGGGDNMSASDRLLMKAADSFMPALASGLQKQTQTPPAENAAPTQPALPAPDNALGAASAELDEEAESMRIKQQAKMALFTLMLSAANKAAARNTSPAAYADKIYDDFDESDVQTIALAPNWFAMMCEAQPGCKAHEAWYNEVRAAIINIAVEDGLLLRDAAGNLTVAPDSDNVDASTGGTDGAAGNATGGTASDT